MSVSQIVKFLHFSPGPNGTARLVFKSLEIDARIVATITGKNILSQMHKNLKFRIES